MTCVADGCDRPIRSKRLGLCRTHAEQQRAGRPLTPIGDKRPNGQGRAVDAGLTCVESDCDRIAQAARGLCVTHYRRRAQGGSGVAITEKRRADPDTRFDRQWRRDEMTGCHVWTGHLVKGYGQFRVTTGKQVGAHVYAYERKHGPVPPGLTLDHLCHKIDGSCGGGVTCVHRACCNPDHVQPETRGNNARRCVPHALRH